MTAKEKNQLIGTIIQERDDARRGVKSLKKELDELKSNHRKLEGIASSLRVGLAGYDPNHPALYR